MIDLRWLDHQVAVMAQLRPEDLKTLAEAGVSMVVNNRPENEEIGQPAGAELAEAAHAAGVGYRELPVRGLPDDGTVEATAALLGDGHPEGRFVFFCRSGLRSAATWAMARRRQGIDAERLRAAGLAAGYDLTRAPL